MFCIFGVNKKPRFWIKNSYFLFASLRGPWQSVKYHIRLMPQLPADLVILSPGKLIKLFVWFKFIHFQTCTTDVQGVKVSNRSLQLVISPISSLYLTEAISCTDGSSWQITQNQRIGLLSDWLIINFLTFHISVVCIVVHLTVLPL